MDTELTQGLTFLVWTSGIFLIVVGIFVVKLLFDLSGLTVSLKKSADIVQTELEPIMKNVNESTTTINNIVQDTNKRFAKITGVYDKVADAVANSVSRLSALSGVLAKAAFKSIFSGIKSVFNKK